MSKVAYSWNCQKWCCLWDIFGWKVSILSRKKDWYKKIRLPVRPTDPFLIDQKIKVYVIVKYRPYFNFWSLHFLHKVVDPKNDKKSVPSATGQIKMTWIYLECHKFHFLFTASSGNWNKLVWLVNLFLFQSDILKYSPGRVYTNGVPSATLAFYTDSAINILTNWYIPKHIDRSALKNHTADPDF